MLCLYVLAMVCVCFRGGGSRKTSADELSTVVANFTSMSAFSGSVCVCACVAVCGSVCRCGFGVMDVRWVVRG